MKLPPFARIGDRDYLVVNFDLPPTDDNAPALAEQFERLLSASHSPRDIVLLRPLSRGEARLLRRATRDAAVEAWAQIVVHDGDRWSPRIK